MNPPIKILESTAELSKCRLYRYSLTRKWVSKNKGLVNWIMLNPSTADAQVDDPTIRRVIAFSEGYGFGSARIMNLFAFRSTDPKAMMRAADPVGPQNDDALSELENPNAMVIVAWGREGRLSGRGEKVARRLLEAGVKLWCLGINAAQPGEVTTPRHPLYLKQTTPLIRYYQ